MISILLTIRKNSKFFSKFLVSYLKNTKDFSNVELLVLASKQDTWNTDLFEYHKDKIRLFYEDMNVGKNGRHFFFNMLAENAKGNWLWHMCDDHYLLEGYDEYVTEFIRLKNIDSEKINMIVPRVDNSGSISHILSRGWYKATGRIGYHGNIDSYLNNVADRMIYTDSAVHHLNEPILHDYTVDPTIMTPEHSKIEIDYSIKVYDFTSPETQFEINKDARALYEAIKEGK